MVHFYENTEHFHAAESYSCANNQKGRTYYCVYMATTVTRTHHCVTLHVHYLVIIQLYRFLRNDV